MWLKASQIFRNLLVSFDHFSHVTLTIITDGATYAFSVLNLNGNGINDLGDQLQNYEHLREVYLNGNAFTNIDKLRTLSLLQILEAKDNKIMDNYFMSETNQQLQFLTRVDLSGNQLTKLR